MSLEAQSLRSTAHLYHYTTAEGLEGIIRTKALWASDFRYMNDAQELKYGIELIKRDIPKLKHKYPGAFVENDRVERKLNYVGFSEPGHFTNDFVMIVSMTKERDLLSQWRGYNGGSGFVLGFEEDRLHEVSRSQGFALEPVVYDEVTQTAALDRAFRDLEESLAHVPLPFTDGTVEAKMWPFGEIDRWFQRLVRMLAFLKHPAFAEEKEYRIVKTFGSFPPECKTRCANHKLIPYIEMALDNLDQNDIGLREILVGPSLAANQGTSVEALLRASKMIQVDVSKSSIPYIPT